MIPLYYITSFTAFPLPDTHPTAGENCYDKHFGLD